MTPTPPRTRSSCGRACSSRETSADCGIALALLALAERMHTPPSPARTGRSRSPAAPARTSVRTMNPDGTGQTPSSGRAAHPPWSPDGGDLLFINECDVRRMPADGSTETMLCGRILLRFPDRLRYEAAGLVSGRLPDRCRLHRRRAHDNFYLELYTRVRRGQIGTATTIADGDSSDLASGRLGDRIHAHTPGHGNRGRVASDATQTARASNTDHRDPDGPVGPRLLAGRRQDRVLRLARDGSVREISSAPASATGAASRTTPAIDREPGWSPDGTKIAFASDRDGNYEIYTMNADGTNQTRITNDPDMQSSAELAAAPDSAMPAPRARPRCGSRSCRPIAQCTSPNRTHGPPLAFGSCSPPTPESAELTTGTPTQRSPRT